MEVIKKLKTHVIYKKRSGRFAVKTISGTSVNGEEKTKLLIAEGLVKVSAPKKVETPEPEAEQEEPATEETEA